MAGRLIIISGPSGVGKSTIAAELLKRRPDLATVASRTTREPRPGDGAGKAYEYVTPAEFEAQRAAGKLLESAEVHGALYGTPREDVERLLAEGRDVLLEIDVWGANQVRKLVPGAVSIFLEPPSWDVLEARLRGRGTEGRDAMRRRLETARHELADAPKFDHRVVNEDLERAVEEVDRILDQR